MKPPTRARRNTKKPQSAMEANVLWTLTEKEALLEALKRFGPEQRDKLQDAVRTKSESQIKIFIQRQKMLANCLPKVPDQNASDKAPIELWQDLAENLTLHDVDYSFVIAQVMSVIGNLEPHDVVSNTDPNYKAIYEYICAMLRNEPTPSVSAIDAAVLLDVLQNLADRLSMLNTVDQRRLMQTKYAALTKLDKQSTSRVNAEDNEDSPVQESTGTSGGAANASTSKDSNSDLELQQQCALGTPRNETAQTKSKGAHRREGKVAPSSEKSTTTFARKRPAAILETDSAGCSGQDSAKSSLSTLNPLNIAVDYLNPRPKKPMHPTWPQSLHSQVKRAK